MSNSDESQVLSQSVFHGFGQGDVSLQVVKGEMDYLLRAKRACDVDETWPFLMRNAADVDIGVAQENLKTLLWRSGLWYLEKWIAWINERLAGHLVEDGEQLGWVKYSFHTVNESPFSDPEPNSPIAVIDRHFCESLYPDRDSARLPGTPDWVIDPWAAIFLHDCSCISCLPENEDRYYFMLDLLPGLIEQASDLPIDQADFLGALHARYQAPIVQFEFLKKWGPTFE